MLMTLPTVCLANENTLPQLATPTTPFSVAACDTISSLSKSQKLALSNAGFTKCSTTGSFNVLVAGTERYPDSYILTTSNVIAQIIDQNHDGLADDPRVAAKLSFISSDDVAPLMQGGVTHKEEKAGDNLGDRVNFRYAFSLQTWKARSAKQARAIIVEEVFHMITTYGYGAVYPQQFGMFDFTSSVACREMSAQQCVNWLHPENSCTELGRHSPPPIAGGCNYASCDCNEWFHQVALILAGQAPGWTSPLIPKTRAALRGTLSSSFLAMMDDPQYHMLSVPIGVDYWPSQAPCKTNADCEEGYMCKAYGGRMLFVRRLLYGAPKDRPRGRCVLG